MIEKKATYSGVFGQVISNLRTAQGIEQEAMAEKMGISQASYSRLENGKATFSIDQMYQASDALGLKVNDLIEKVDNYTSHLAQEGIKVESQVRGNATKPTQSNEVGDFIAGAALAAIVIGAIMSTK
jgi:transcriptional regulator with XRE-family HTH domain